MTYKYNRCLFLGPERHSFEIFEAAAIEQSNKLRAKLGGAAAKENEAKNLKEGSEKA